MTLFLMWLSGFWGMLLMLWAHKDHNPPRMDKITGIEVAVCALWPLATLIGIVGFVCKQLQRLRGFKIQSPA